MASEAPDDVVLLGEHFFCVKDGPKGRGLFAIVDIPPRQLLHMAPAILVTRDEYETHMKYTVLEHYLFNAAGDKLLALGYGSLFNHSRQPNVDYRVDPSSRVIRYTSGHRTIQLGEELCINYGSNLWFDDTDGAESTSGSDLSDGEDFEAFLGKIELNDNGDN